MKLKSILSLVLCVGMASVGLAQEDVTFIKGDLNIRYDSRINADSNGIPEKDTSDVYTINLNVSNSSAYRGTIVAVPYVAGGTFSSNQLGSLTYSIESDVINPKNPAQIKKGIGKLFGVVPVSENNVYDFTAGSVKSTTFSSGQGRGLESRFSGIAVGKPPVKKVGLIDAVKKELKMTNAKGKSISVTKYDKMEFQSLVIPAGPIQIYPESIVSGVMIYDYGRSAWYFQNVTISYTGADGRRIQDTIAGNIRWNKDQYDFDVHVNEPVSTEASVFTDSDESSFFAVDTSIPALTGTMKYKDTVTGGKVLASSVTIDLVGNKLTKQQTMYLNKLIFLVSVVPLNAE